MNILVIDVGTSSMRGILFNQNGQKLSEVQEFYQAVYGKNSWVEQNPADWENALYKILRQSVQNSEEIKQKISGIAITSQRSSVIPVDKNISPLCNAIMWQDKRTNALCEAMESMNDKVFSLCGARINPVFSGPKMMWIRQEWPDIYKNTFKFMVIPDYLIYLMTGRICTDYTYGSRSLLMNIRTHRWDDELFELFNVEKEKLCDLVEPGSVCGYINKKFSAITGCPEGIPVITAGGDQQCGAIGQGVVENGILSVTTGTGGYLITSIAQVPQNLKQDVICNYSSIRGQYILESSVLTCCSAFDWFRKQFYTDISFDVINKDIECTPVGANGCLCIPYFMGKSTPDWNNKAKASFTNITLGTTRQDMLRSLLEGICFEIRNGIDIMGKYTTVSDIYINGGLSNSSPFNEMQANVYGRKVIRRGKADATARGALMVAATEMNIYTDVKEAFECVSRQDDVCIYYPEEEIAREYEKLRKQMNCIYGNIYR